MQLCEIITSGDKFLIVSIILITILMSITIFQHRDDGAYVVIEVDGKAINRIRIDKTDTISVSGSSGLTKVEIRNGKARIISSSCPSKFCIKSGSIKNIGQMIVCVPNHVVVRIEGEKKNNFDVITE